MYQRIIVPLDGSPLAESALPHAQALAEPQVAEIVLLRVVLYSVRDFMLADPLLAESLSDDLLEIRRRAQQYLERAAGPLRAAGLHVRIEIVDHKNVAQAVLECAERLRADLIVISTHGRGGVARWLLGSTATQIVQAAHIPVFLVRPDVKTSPHE